jgi:hypothetical protein
MFARPYQPSAYSLPSFSAKESLVTGPVAARKLVPEVGSGRSEATFVREARAEGRTESRVSFGPRDGSFPALDNFTARVVESFSDLSLGPGLGDTQRVHKVRLTTLSLPQRGILSLSQSFRLPGRCRACPS